jgi:hypothetical protein
MTDFEYLETKVKEWERALATFKEAIETKDINVVIMNR